MKKLMFGILSFSLLKSGCIRQFYNDTIGLYTVFPVDSLYIFAGGDRRCSPNFYIYYDSGSSILYLLPPSDDRVFIDIFDISGRKIAKSSKFFRKGENYFIFDKNLNYGVYFIKLKTSFLNKRFKILYLK